MKRIFFVAVLAIVTQFAFAQSIDFPATEYTQDPKANYRLYTTKNAYYFIKLDTRTGQMEIVRWNLNGKSRIYPLSDIKRISSLEEEIPGRFTLYATTTPSNFILLDQIDGRTWQIHWHTDQEKSLVESID